MKKFLVAIGVLLFAAALAFTGFTLVKMIQKQQAAPASAQDDAASAASSTAVALPQPELGVYKLVETEMDLLEALDYEIKQNRDTVGWLIVPNTLISNSVLQAHDNTAYLRTDERHQPSIYGCYFADYTCSIGPREVLSPNTVIYGHSDLKDNPDGPRFSQLFKFTDPEFARQNPYIQFSTIDDFMDWEIFAVFYPSVDMNYIETNLSGSELVALANEAKAQSIYDYNVTVGETDKILTLSTCTVKYGSNDYEHRFVVMAKLVPEGTEKKVNADLKEKTSTDQQTEE